MKKLLLKSAFVILAIALAVSCKKPPPPIDPNDTLKKNIETIKSYVTKEPQVEYEFTFLGGNPSIYQATEKGKTNVIYKGTWEVKNMRIFLYKQIGIEFNKIEGSEVLQDGRLINLKSGATVLNLFATK